MLDSLDKITKTRLKKLGVSHLLDFIIHYVPKGYMDTTLSTQLIPHHIATLKVQIYAMQTQGFGKNARLHIHAQALDFNESINLVIFHPKPFHKKMFAIDKTYYIQGKLELFNSTFSIAQPKIITHIDTIAPKFATKLLNNNTMCDLATLLITMPHLQAYLPAHIAHYIYEIFHPTRAFLDSFNAESALPKAHIEALKFTEIYHYLRTLSRKKWQFRAKYMCQNDISAFLESLPFSLTKGQRSAIADIKADFASGKAARRLIMGDVGCGKTMVILSAVMLVYPYTSVLMAPTSILATQLYMEAKKYLPSYVHLHLVTAKTPKLPPNALLDNKGHFIIGTQALLYRSLESSNIALIMSDEQHRFGTRERHALEKMGQSNVSEVFSADSSQAQAINMGAESNINATLFDNVGFDVGLDMQSFIVPKALDSSQDTKVLDSAESSQKAYPHTLQFSATPIPRTLAMINTAFIALSTISDMPFQKDISTHIIDKSGFKGLLAHLHSEVNKGNQAIIVYPLVEESQRLNYLSLSEGLSFWQGQFKRVYSTYGKDKHKEQIIEDFEKNGEILLATTLIEVGISLPKVSTIVIVAPERLGLATLHQLRGRVSRNGLKGYCFLYTNTPDNERLSAFSKTLSGFEIAELDLAYRSSGDLLRGERQSGDVFNYINLATDEAIIKAAKAHLNAQH